MTIKDLNRDQLQQVKIVFYTNDCNEPDGPLSWADLVNIDDIVDDETVYKAYDGVEFTPDDFFSFSN